MNSMLVLVTTAWLAAADPVATPMPATGSYVNSYPSNGYVYGAESAPRHRE